MTTLLAPSYSAWAGKYSDKFKVDKVVDLSHPGTFERGRSGARSEITLAMDIPPTDRSVNADMRMALDLWFLFNDDIMKDFESKYCLPPHKRSVTYPQLIRRIKRYVKTITQ